ncbi:PPK2 family polyphosphate kinase [Spirosoma endophyticum]|uniref:Polyphosphate:nucleotide phosphotransferase, PPK2 family n=1 Tax=Spirosoma endophyticum TaxID=662367 RepID=A0A1I1WSJ9_9BACT|nr:PPK2 family polyphosphate kinase [Spirosoma endophyticum]SFD98019.1 polyphosphate:nucleotide phosphotransferase, PPK2 family [Spirosoma endophyticum]
MKKFNTNTFRYDGKKPFSANATPTLVEPFYTDEADLDRQLDELAERMDQAQNRMHADEHYGMLVVFQAMDAAGKDSSIRRVFKGVNPSRFQMAPFKKPAEEDLKHDFLWRFWQELPERGNIGVFNRSYYEEVLALRVHPERLKQQLIPENLLPTNDQTLWKQRFGDIVHFEDYLFRNGFPIVKFYLHVVKEEQGKRLIARLEDTEKQWKLSENDLEEREFWPEYMQAYEDTINATATRQNPWYVIPSDDRDNQQLIIARILTDVLESLPVSFPKTDEKEAQKLIRQIKKQDGGK